MRKRSRTKCRELLRLASPSLALPYAALPLLQCVWAGALGGVAAAGVAKLSAELK